MCYFVVIILLYYYCCYFLKHEANNNSWAYYYMKFGEDFLLGKQQQANIFSQMNKQKETTEPKSRIMKAPTKFWRVNGWGRLDFCFDIKHWYAFGFNGVSHFVISPVSMIRSILIQLLFIKYIYDILMRNYHFYAPPSIQNFHFGILFRNFPSRCGAIEKFLFGSGSHHLLPC